MQRAHNRLAPVTRVRQQPFGQARNPGGTEVDKAHGAAAVNHHVLRPQVLVQHLFAMKGLQPLGDLCHKITDGIKIGVVVVDHPLRQCLPFDKLHRHVDMLAGPVACMRPQYIGAMDTPRHPLLQQKPVKVIRITTQVRGRRFQHHLLPRQIVHRQVHVAACTGMQFTQNGVALKTHPWRQWGRQCQPFAQRMQLVRLCLGQCLYPHQLHGHVVLRTARQRCAHKRLGGAVKVVGKLLQGRPHGCGIKVGMRAVGRQHVNGADLCGHAGVVNLYVGAGAQGPRQIRLHR
ncbi:hypothetical protein D3C71_1425440 [compost metagenome]